MKNLILISMPAAGKGTLVSMLADKYNYIGLSTGDMLRNSTDEKIKNLLNNGELVSDEKVLSVIKEKLTSIKDKHYILDGFPRTLEQAKEYDNLLESLNQEKPLVIYLKVTKENVIKRISTRLICNNCKKVYSKTTKDFLPKKEGICDICGSPLISRKDDNEESVLKRIKQFNNKTKVLLNYYKDNLYEVDANNSKDDTFDQVKKIIN